MADQGQGELLPFDEFRARVGASETRTRAALLALRLRPIPLEADRRQLRYRAEWAEQVRQFLAASDASDG